MNIFRSVHLSASEQLETEVGLKNEAALLAMNSI